MKQKSKGKYLKQEHKKSKMPHLLIILIVLIGLLTTGVFFFTRRNGDNVTISNADEAISHAKKIGREYGYKNAMDELTVKSTVSIDDDCYYRLQQNYQGIPVYGKTLVYSISKDGKIASITGNIMDIDTNINLASHVDEIVIQDSIRAFIHSTYGSDKANSFRIVNGLQNEKCIYLDENTGKSTLAYCYVISIDNIYCHYIELIIDASSGQIISHTNLQDSFVSNLSILEESNFNFERNDSMQLLLLDQNRRIIVYNIDNESALDSSSTTNVRIDDSYIIALDPDSEVDRATYAAANIAKVYDYYESELNRRSYDNSNGELYLLICNKNVFADNAVANGNFSPALILIGENNTKFTLPIERALDILAHEYTHLIIENEVGLIEEVQQQALNEGLADIMGNLIEFSYKDEADSFWNLGEDAGYIKYSMANLVTMHDYDTTDTTGHHNAQIIAHASYLMWNGIDGTNRDMRIPSKELAKLWYRAMLMMPSDCNFIECRRLVEYAAQSMEELSDQQRKCVSEAFDKVGIISDDPVETQIDYRLSDNGVLSVFDKNGDLYSGYTLDIQGIQNERFVSDNADGSFNFYNGGSWYESIQNVSEAPLTLDLPYGCYTFTITDSHNPDYTYSFTVSVSSNGTENNIDLFTAFEKPLVVTITDPTIPEDTHSQITPGFYAQVDNELNLLTIHEVTPNNITFTAWWYRIWDISKANATLNGNIASFNYTASNNDSLYASGTIESQESTVILTLNECTQSYVDTGVYRYKLIGVLFTDDQLNAISLALGVPEDLEVQITQGEPAYWEGGGFYRTPIEVYYNGELVAGASVNSLTGELAGSIFMYTAPTSTSDSGFNIESTFGFEKAWDIHDRSTTEHFVTSLAFNNDGTFSCAVGWYLSEWYVAFTGTYEVSGDELILHYLLDGQEKTTSYQVKWDNQILRQASEENLVIPHQIGSEYAFEENPWYTASDLAAQIETFNRYS